MKDSELDSGKQSDAAMFLEELHISGDTMVAMNHSLDDVPTEAQGSFYLHDILVLYSENKSNQKTMKDINAVPRRSRLDLNTPAELAITNAMQEVEKAGADVLLTNAINLLHQAKDFVSDFVDQKKPIRLEHQKNEVIKIGKDLFRCICSDHDFAVFSPIVWKEDHWQTNLETLFSYPNTPQKGLYERYHCDFFAMIEETPNVSGRENEFLTDNERELS